jgi:hypothetical protein
MNRGCLGLPGRPCRALTSSSRCPACERAHRARYRGQWPALARSVIAAYRATHGDVCPGFGVPSHALDPADWVVDHDLGPMCRRCNGVKAATADTTRAIARTSAQPRPPGGQGGQRNK